MVTQTSMFTRLKDLGLAFVLTILIALMLSQASYGEEPRRLNILLTNDDGYQAVRISAMKQALQSAGHHVTVVAPLTQRSGSSAALTIGRVPYKKVDKDIWALDATPFSCALIGLSAIVDEVPDLIVSGTNIGANLGPATILSGTIGGGLAGINAELVGLPHSVPSIAFSTDAPVREDQDPSAYREHFDNVAAFAVTLIDALAGESGPLLPSRTMLNVNYPPRAPKDILGVKQVTQADSASLNFSFAEENTETGSAFVMKLDMDKVLMTKGATGSEIKAYRDGYITVVPLDGNYTADRTVQDRVKTRLGTVLSGGN